MLQDKGPVSGISDISVEDDLPDDETNPEEEWHQVIHTSNATLI